MDHEDQSLVSCGVLRAQRFALVATATFGFTFACTSTGPESDDSASENGGTATDTSVGGSGGTSGGTSSGEQDGSGGSTNGDTDGTGATASGSDEDGSGTTDAPVVRCDTVVNFQTYGAVGDGITDDTAALQDALDGEAELIADPGATFLIGDTLEIDQDFAHTICWNGATLITSSALNPMVEVDKRQAGGDLTSMHDLLVDGNVTANRGVEVNSRVEMFDVDARGFRQPSSASPAGFFINFYDDTAAYGTWLFDGCDVSDVVGASNGTTTDSLGAANGYLIYWREVPTETTTLDVRNATVSDCWGEDAQNVAIFSSGIDISDTTSGTRWTTMNFFNWERRCIKGFAANNTFVDCSFTDPEPDDPRLYSSNKSGMVVIGAGSGATGGENQVFEGCTFTAKGYDGRVIATDTAHVEFNNCNWEGGSDLLFTDFGVADIGPTQVCGSTFGPGSTIGDYGGITYEGDDVITLDTNNVYAEPDYVSIDPSFYQEQELSCPR